MDTFMANAKTVDKKWVVVDAAGQPLGVLASQIPTAICIHRPVLPSILEALDLAPANLATGEMLVTHLTPDGVHAIERHRPQA